MTLFFVALACSVSVCWAEDVSAVIAISADGSELIYEMATVQKITFVQGAETSSMTIDRKGTHSDVTGLRCVMFGTRNLLPTELESVIDDDTKVYVFPNPVQNELRITGVEENVIVTVYICIAYNKMLLAANGKEEQLWESVSYLYFWRRSCY